MPHHLILLALSSTGKRRLSEVGELIGGVGALCLLFAGVTLYRDASARAARGLLLAAAGVLFGVAFLVQIYAQHF